MEKNIDVTPKTDTRLKQILTASVVAIFTNIGLGLFKAVVGVISNSIAITMDAINNFTDAGSSLVTILSSYFAAKDPDKKHPFGYGRTEYLGTLLIAVLILYAGISALIESVKGIISPEAAEYSTVSLVIIIVAVVVKAALTMYIVSTGKKANSDSLVAAGKESMGDIAISLTTIVTAFVYIFTGISLEAWIGAIIAVLIIKAGAEILFETIGKILGSSGDVALVKDIKKAIAEHEGVNGAFDLILHNYGPDYYQASVHIEVEDDMTMNQFDQLSRDIHEDILKRFGVLITAIGVYSVNTTNTDIISTRETVREIALSCQHVNGFHGFFLDTEKKMMRFDIVISFDAKDRHTVQAEVIEKINAKYPEYKITTGLDTDYNEL